MRPWTGKERLAFVATTLRSGIVGIEVSHLVPEASHLIRFRAPPMPVCYPSEDLNDLVRSSDSSP